MWSGRVGRWGGGLVVSECFDKESNFFREGGGVFFYKLTRNPNLPNLTFFFGGGGGGGGGRVKGRGRVSVRA